VRSNSRYGSRLIATVFAAGLLIPSMSAAQSVDHGGYRPHYQGYGVNTPGGRGGAILRVTNVNDSGPGSLRAALEANGPRFVIFETSGTISLSYPIIIDDPYLTVAGQTAPSPGITIRYHPIIVDTHDVVFQHVRVRMGDTAYQPNDSFVFYVRYNADNVVLDHVSLSWGMATILALSSENWKRVSVLDCLLAYNLNVSGTNTGMAALNAFSWQAEVTYARNLFVHNSNRLPWFGAGVRGSLINNVAYGTGNSSGDPTSQYGFFQIMVANYDFYGSNGGWNVEAVAMNNRFIGSYGTGSGGNTGTHPATKSVDVWLNPNDASKASRLYLAGNVGPHMTLADQWSGVDFYESGSRATLDYGSEPTWHSSFTFNLISPGNVLPSVLAGAGARPLDRDSVDTMAVRQTTAGAAGDTANMGSRIRSQNDMGGWPTLAVVNRSLQVPASPHAVAAGQSFRTNIEMWLETFAQALEPGTFGVPESGSTIPPPQNLRVISETP
jgi:hypothetical protein